MKTSKALVFDIKRFAIHDGQGIRTTIFFKGCPLKCKWCQNPEGLSANRRPIYFEKRCIHCKRCQEVANEGQIEFKNNRPYFNLQYSGDFDNLIRACPSNAICYDSQEYDIDSLMEKIKDDEVFYKYGGGVTFSGGEPLMQGEFLVKILKRCQQEGIHCALETTLFAPLELIKEVLLYLDLIYIDLKVFDDDKHKEYTNVSSKLIKENLEYVLTNKPKAKIIIRTPLIPTMTATDDNIISIAKYLKELDPTVNYELLNYNPLASSKYELVDLQYELGNKYKMFTKEEMEHFYQLVYQTGLKNLIIE